MQSRHRRDILVGRRANLFIKVPQAHDFVVPATCNVLPVRGKNYALHPVIVPVELVKLNSSPHFSNPHDAIIIAGRKQVLTWEKTPPPWNAHWV
ncbi:MAG TPA: hypothetical protein VKK79_07090 [Candidatus Lokiarchaeia archaeon]|nr:hypothetical protein [Candidatus Lokiarchaeia archaeon]